MLPVNVLLLVLLPWGLSRAVAKPGLQRRYFLLSTYFCIATGLGIVALYNLVYGGGDYKAYEKGTIALVHVAYRDPAFAWDLAQNFSYRRGSEALSQIRYAISSAPEFDNLLYYIGYGKPERVVMLYFAAIGLPGGGDFVFITLMQAILSSLIHFKFAKVLVARYDALSRPLYQVALFIPGVLIWGTAVSKDSILLNAILLIVIAALQPKQTLRHPVWLGLLVLHILLAYLIRPFVLTVLLPLTLLFILQRNLQVLSGSVRYLVQPVVYGLTGIGIIVLIADRSDVIAQEAGQITQKAIGASSFQTRQALQDRGETSSAYTLGNYNPTPVGLLATFPIATATALFRPLPWEVRNPLMIGNMLESLGLLLATLYVLVRLGPLRLARTIGADPFLVFCLLFTLLYGFLVGFTSGNYGSLWRYRIPIVVFFPIVLVVAHSAVSARTQPAPAA